MPEEQHMPGEWGNSKCEDPIQKMIILRAFRPDRVNFAIKNYVKAKMGKDDYITSKPTSIAEVIEQSRPDLPVIFVLSQGTDPTDMLLKRAEEYTPVASNMATKDHGNKGVKLLQVSLGKGQGAKAQKLLEESAQEGHWVFLSNCHLSVSLLPDLESRMDMLFKKKLNPNFRIFMSAVPIDDFPISLLQRSLKIT